MFGMECYHDIVSIELIFIAVINLTIFPLPADARGVPGPMSPTRESAVLGDEEEEEEEEEFGNQETLVTARPAKAEAEFSQQDTLVIREDQPRVRQRVEKYSGIKLMFAIE